ncbi:MAG: hypothetical protein QF415_15345, partial [Candidatus Undinarchaeales archaeon]|nr:hypothetical protein [Candidatus Undinarchaeales archaeon]
VEERLAAFKLEVDAIRTKDPQEYARGMVGIVAAVEELTLDEPMDLHLVLDLDIPGDLSPGPTAFLLKYSGSGGEVIVHRLAAGDEFKAEYSLSIAQSVVGEIISSYDPDDRARELYGQGLFTVSGAIGGSGRETVLVVVGEGSKADDSIAAAEIGQYLGSQEFLVRAMLDSEVSASDLAAHRVIVVGGPSVNSLARELGVTKWDLCEGSSLPCERPYSVIRGFSDGFAPGQEAMLVAGWEAEHTRMAGRVFRDAEKYSDELSDGYAMIVGSIHDPAGVAVRSAGAAIEV